MEQVTSLTPDPRSHEHIRRRGRRPGSRPFELEDEPVGERPAVREHEERNASAAAGVRVPSRESIGETGRHVDVVG